MTTPYTKPLPVPANEALSRPFWEAAKRHELIMPKCNTCARVFFYPREVCPDCLSSDLGWTPATGRGRVYSYTVVHQPVNAAFQPDAPFVYAVVQLDEGPQLVTNIVDCAIDAVAVNMPVTAVFDDVTPEVTLVKFKPA